MNIRNKTEECLFTVQSKKFENYTCLIVLSEQIDALQ
jgi:hypothetical protein